MNNRDALPQQDAHRVLRRCVLAIFLLGMSGCGIELLLIEHYEDWWQLIPLGLFGLSVAALVSHTLVRRAATIRLFQLTMFLFLVGGILGIVLHYQAKALFASEMDPSLTGISLVRRALTGKMPPVLAPGMMMQLGLLGLAWTWRHPATTPAKLSTDKGE